MKCEKLKMLVILGALLTPVVFAEGIANQTTSNTTPVANTTNTTTPTTSNTDTQDTEAINNFFKDSDYEHFQPEKGYEFVDPGYLGGRSGSN